MGQQYFVVKFPIEVIRPLEELIRAHPDWGLKTPSEAAKHAVVHYTEFLRRRAAAGLEQASVMEEMMLILQRAARRDPGLGKKKAQA